MTVNGLIAVIAMLSAIVVGAMAGVALWQSRRTAREWPPAFLLAVGCWLVTLFLVIGRIAFLRWVGLQGPLGNNGLVTLLFWVLFFGFSVALLRRLLTGTLATDADRRRAVGGSG